MHDDRRLPEPADDGDVHAEGILQVESSFTAEAGVVAAVAEEEAAEVAAVDGATTLLLEE